MADNISNFTKLDKAWKSSQHKVGTDPDKAIFEETRNFLPYLSTSDIIADEIPLNNPSGAITAGLVTSGTALFTKDVTVGGEYSGYYTTEKFWIHPHVYGNSYAPKFYYNSGSTLIPDGDLYAYAAFDYIEGYLLVENNTTTAAWDEPIAVDGFYYTGRFLDEKFDDVVGASGSISLSQLLQTSGDIVNQIPINLEDLSNVSNSTPTDGQFIQYNSGIASWEYTTVAPGGSSGDVTFAQLVQTSGVLQVQIDEINNRTQRGIVNGDIFSGVPLEYTVTLNQNYIDNNYVVLITSTLNRNFYVDSSYTSGEFKIISGSNRPMLSSEKIFWRTEKV